MSPPRTAEEEAVPAEKGIVLPELCCRAAAEPPPLELLAAGPQNLSNALIGGAWGSGR